jgi:hexosaminidase
LDQASPKIDIRYALQGHDPDAASMLYTKPLELAPGTDIRAASFKGSEQVSRIWSWHLDAHQGARRSSHELELCSNGVGLLLEASGPGMPDTTLGSAAPLAVDIVSPCWIYHGADLTQGPQISAAVVPLPFNYELGPAVEHIRLGDARTPQGELEVHIDSCDAPSAAVLPLGTAAGNAGVTQLQPQKLPAVAGRHDLCLRFARPRLDPVWALDWAQIGE